MKSIKGLREFLIKGSISLYPVTLTTSSLQQENHQGNHNLYETYS